MTVLRGMMWPLMTAGGLNTTFNFDSTLATFTPAMAKRKAASQPFAAASLVQGKLDASGTPDIVSLARGTQISGNFYPNWDAGVGSIVVWITPEWAGNDGLKHVIVQFSTNGALYKDTDNKLYLSLASSKSVSVSISSWAAGTTYLVIARWDSQNTLDGANYACLTINNSSTFGCASYTPEAPNATIYIGSDGTTSPANAILSGLTVYRRPLWDGTYGCNVNNGTETTTIYAAGAGADPCATTGSWDAVLCVPTNATVGALGTTGEAWSHPHASGLLGTGGIDGLMLSTAWANWTAIGSASSPDVLAASERNIGIGYKFTAGAANDGYKYTKTVTALSNYVLRGLAHSDGTSQPVLELWDETNGASIGKLTAPTPGNLVVNGGFDPDTSSWSASNSTLASIAGGQSGNCLRITNTANNGYAYQSIAVSPGATYTFTFYQKQGSVFYCKAYIGTSAGGNQIYDSSNFGNAAWTQKTVTVNSGSNSTIYISFVCAGVSGDSVLIDTVSFSLLCDRTNPFVAIFSGQAPTGCTSISVRCYNAAASGVTYWHQVELLANIVSNPSVENGSGDPYIPTGWANYGCIAGDCAAETTIVHSGSQSVKIMANSQINRALRKTTSQSGLKYITYGAWAYRPPGSTATISFLDNTTQSSAQAALAGAQDVNPTIAAWKHFVGVQRSITSVQTNTTFLANTGSVYIDDFYAFGLTTVTLTVTPATLANSTEATGVRVDGRDVLSQPVTKLTATKGTIRFKWTPRHSAATQDALTEAGSMICVVGTWASANYIALRWTPSTVVRLQGAFNSVAFNGTWSASGLIIAGTTYAVQIDYSGGVVNFRVDGVVKITANLTTTFSVVPTITYFGTWDGTTLQSDATYLAP